MREQEVEHRSFKAIRGAIELCPRCSRGPMFRPQPDVIYCVQQGCCNRADDKGVIYISVDSIGSILGADQAQALALKLHAVIRQEIPHYPMPKEGPADAESREGSVAPSVEVIIPHLAHHERDAFILTMAGR